MKISFATRLKEAMDLRQIKQSELVELTKIGKSAISQYLSGQFEPKQKNIYKIATALNVNEAWLMGYDVPTNPRSHNFYLELPEQTHIEKYRDLDSHGREIVDSVLNIESARIEASKKNIVKLTASNPIADEPEIAEMKVYLQPAAAGIGNYLTDSDDYDIIPFPADEVPSRADFGVRISGDSMEPKISDGDIVWVKATHQVEDGEIGIFILDGDVLCKKLHIDYDKRTIELVSLNSKYKPRKIGEEDDLRTVGKVLL